jgi:nitrous oxidase accessory protein NosD
MRSIAVLIVFLAGLASLQAATIDVPGDYPTIQGGIDAAQPGDTVYVQSGTYHEHISVEGGIYVIGESRTNTIIDADGAEVAVTMTSGDATFSRFTVMDCGVGIFVFSSFNTIADCRVSGAGSGFFIGMPTPGSDLLCGIGADILESGAGRIMCDHNTVKDNHIENNDIGIEFEGYADVVEQNDIHGNMIRGGTYGVYDRSTIANNYTENLISANDTGMYLDVCVQHQIYHNDLLNTVNAVDLNVNDWDDGYPSGGNLWGDYTGEDLDNDGIGDTPYEIPGGDAVDNYPLMYPYTIQCGDVDLSGQVDVDDIIRLISIIFPGGFDPTIPYPCLADANGSGGMDIDDVVYLIAFIFSSGAPPVESCCPFPG